MAGKRKSSNPGQGDQMAGFLFNLRHEDIVDRADFGGFELIKTKAGIMYRNHTGFHIWTTPYAILPDGRRGETSLYQWLDNMIKAKSELGGDPGAMYDSDGTFTNSDVLDTMRIVTEACMTWPMTAFIDVNHASEFAKDYIERLAAQANDLRDAMSALSDSPDEDGILAEERFRADAIDLLGETAPEIERMQDKIKEV